MKCVRVVIKSKDKLRGVHTAVRSSNPRERRNVGEVTGVQVSIGGVAELVATAVVIVNT